MFMIFVLSILGSVFSFDFGWENDVVKRYSQIKIINSCLGETFLSSWKESMLSASKKCHKEDISGDLPSLNDILKEINTRNKYGPSNPSNQSPFLIPHVPHSGQQPIFVYVVPQQPQSQQGRTPFIQLQGTPQPYLNYHQTSRIWKRSTPTTDDAPEDASRTGKDVDLAPEWRTQVMDTFKLLKPPSNVHTLDHQDTNSLGDISPKTGTSSQAGPTLKTLRTKLASKISNITCVLRNMELIDDKGMPNYRYNTDLIKRLGISEDLKSDLLEAQDFCREFSMCVPTHRLNDQLARGIGYSFVFMKCMHQKVLKACITNDLKTTSYGYKDMLDFGFNNLNRLSELNVNDKYQSSPQNTVEELQSMLYRDDEIGFGF